MPPLSQIESLTPETRTWLEEELKSRNFSGYRELTDELNRRLAAGGVKPVHHESVRRHGSRIKELAQFREELKDYMASDDGLPDPKEWFEKIVKRMRMVFLKTLYDLETSETTDVRSVEKLMKCLDKLLRYEDLVRRRDPNDPQSVANRELAARYRELAQKIGASMMRGNMPSQENTEKHTTSGIGQAGPSTTAAGTGEKVVVPPGLDLDKILDPEQPMKMTWMPRTWRRETRKLVEKCRKHQTKDLFRELDRRYQEGLAASPAEENTEKHTTPEAA